ADVNCNGSMLTPLLLATMHGGYTNFIKLLLKAGPDPNIPDDEQRHLQRRKALIKSKADTAFKQKEYKIATKIYDLAIAHGESATLYANRSVCKLLIGDGEGALSDALMCECCDLIGQKLATVKLQLTCYSSLVTLFDLLCTQEYEQARDALLDAHNLDPGNAEIEGELQKARELMKNPPGECEQCTDSGDATCASFH
uniref:Uncharacterized protein n=1 Tax=Aegilops tauschii subsp. strangulata TaxID=200361 RepID=A0A453EAQ8_AEGTS